MRYIFKILILGLDGETISLYTIRAFGEEGENKGPYLELYKEVKVLENTCDLEINAITDVENTDLDELINTVDGIIYFINPLKNEEKEVFNSIFHDIRKISRNIPLVIMYYDDEGIIPLSVNSMLENTWLKYFDIEAFVNVNPREFHHVLHCLCIAMISGDSPLSLENAWMRFPIYIQLANIYFKKAEKESKPEYYFYSAQAIKKAAMIADIFNKEEYYIICEQAAFLFSKVNLYLEAAKILENVDLKKSENFKRLYAESMILEGNILFNKRKFDESARQYESAAQWAALEHENEELKNEAFKLAINSWISACKMENAFNIIKNLPHDLTLEILHDFLIKIIEMVDFLVKEQKLLIARNQLSVTINTYQKRNLSEELHVLVTKLIEVLKLLLAKQIEEDRFSAYEYYFEIKSVCETYDLELPNQDQQLKVLINRFLNNLEFGDVTLLLNEINSLKLKKELTARISWVEDENKELLKKQKEENLRKNRRILNSYIERELQIIAETNLKTIKEANVLIEKGDYLKAANLVKSQANFWSTIGREEIQDQMLKKVLDIILVGKIFDKFQKSYYELINKTRKIYLRNKVILIKEKLKEFTKEGDFEEVFNNFIFFISIYREQSLFDQSKEIAELSVDYIKSEAFRIIKETEDKKAIDRALGLTLKATEFSQAYLDNHEINFDKIYQIVVKIYINLGDFSSAHAITDKILDKSLKKNLNKDIEKGQSEISANEARRAIEAYDESILKERESIIRKRAHEAQQDKQDDLRQRTGLKRLLYDKGLAFLKDQDFERALKEYNVSIKFLLDRKNLNLVGISLAVSLLLLYKLKRVNDLEESLNGIKKNLGSLEISFSETYPITLLEYIIEIEKLGDIVKFKESLQYIEHLALFDEELDLLYKLLDKSKKTADSEDNKHLIVEEIDLLNSVVSKEQKHEKKEVKLSRKELAKQKQFTIQLDQMFGIIQKKMPDVRREKQEHLKKRTFMKNRIYTDVIALLEKNSFKDAGEEYLKLAYTLSKRKKFESSSLMVLMQGLALLTAKEPLNEIRSNINRYLSSLGLNKKLLEDTYPIRCIEFLLTVISHKVEKYFPTIKEILDILPLFEEEKNLIDNLLKEEGN